MSSLTVASIGAGYFAGFQLAAWQRLQEVDLVAICDRDPNRLSSLKDRFGQTKLLTDLNAIDLQAKPDLIDIATPPATHFELVRWCADRQINVICQKPLAPDYETAQALVEYAEQAGITLAVHENFRFMPWFQEIKRWLTAARLGRLHSIAVRMRPGDGQGNDAYLSRQPYFQQMRRFLVHETAIHFIDVFRYLAGEISGVFARLRRLNPAIKGEDAGYILVEFANGGTGLFDGNRLNDHVAQNPRLTMGEVWVEGEKGSLRLDGDGRLWFKPHGEAETEHHYSWQKRGFGGDCVYAIQAHFVAHFCHRQPLQNSGREYLRNIEIEEMVYRSAREQRWLPQSI